MSYRIKISKEAQAAVQDFRGDFEARLRSLVPQLPGMGSPLILSPESDPKRLVLTLQGEKEGESWSVVGRVQPRQGALAVLYVYRNFHPPKMSREEALASVKAGIGQHPWPFSGAEYVRRIKREWRGLLPRDRRHSCH